jgi:Leucine-rich repeat (LRR) protein
LWLYFHLQLEGLKSKSLLENLGDGSEEIGMHDLWREFAIMKSEGGEFDPRPWIYEKIYGLNDSRREEPKLSRGGGWENLQRLCVVGDGDQGCSVEEIDLGCFSNLRVLKLVDVYIDTEVLDVSKLTQLRSLEIVNDGPQNRSININILGLQRLRSLVFLHLHGMQIRTASIHEEIGDLTSLQGLYINGLESPSSSLIPDFSRLNRLRDVSLYACVKVDMIAGLSSRMTNLKRLQLISCHSLCSCHGVGDLVALEELDLSECDELEELPDLGRIKHLLKLNISGCKLITVVPGFGGLVSLQEFRADYCDRLAELPKLYKLVNLQRLSTEKCPSLKAIPGLSDLVALEDLSADSGGLERCHDLRKLTKLETVWVFGWGAQGLPCLADLVNLKCLVISFARELTGLSDLTSIQSLQLWRCEDLERLPDLHKLSRLEKLDISICTRLREWNTGGLRLFGMDLHIAGTFLRLKTLDLNFVRFTKIPDLSSFPQLSELNIRVCWELTSLTSSAPLTALKRLEISECRSLRALPDVNHLVSLSTLRLEDCGKLKLTAHEKEKLETMCPGLKLNERHLSNMEPEHDHDERAAKRPKFVENK